MRQRKKSKKLKRPSLLSPNLTQELRIFSQNHPQLMQRSKELGERMQLPCPKPS